MILISCVSSHLGKDFSCERLISPDIGKEKNAQKRKKQYNFCLDAAPIVMRVFVVLWYNSNEKYCSRSMYRSPFLLLAALSPLFWEIES